MKKADRVALLKLLMEPTPELRERYKRAMDAFDRGMPVAHSPEVLDARMTW